MNPSSRVIKISCVSQDMLESDLRELLQPFGAISKVLRLHSKNQALLEMEQMHGSESAMQYYSAIQPYIRGKPVYLDFSHNDLAMGQSIRARNSNPEVKPKRILSVALRHVTYPIKLDILHDVFKDYGAVEKIITIEKSDDFQALIQYQTQKEAQEALHALHGKNLYDGCCQLDIHLAKETELEIHYNSEQSWDFTNALLPTARPRVSQIGRERDLTIALAFDGVLPPGVTGTSECCALTLHNLNCDKVDEDKLFNLFSMYGWVVRIKISYDEPVHALVEMADGLQAELAAHYLQGAMLFGKQLEINCKKWPNIVPDSRTKEYWNSKYNRSKRFKMYKLCSGPTKMIRISSLPISTTEAELQTYMSEHGRISDLKLYEVYGKKNALVLFDTVEDATNALVSKSNRAFNGSDISISFTSHVIYSCPSTESS